MKKEFAILAGLAVLVLGGCSSIPYTMVSVDNFEWRSPKLTVDKTFNVVTNVLIERGFDIKVTSKESGFLTTEYKKYASAGDDPPFDYYLQLKASIRQDTKDPKKVLVRLTPISKGVNRMNAGAFTEANLWYLTVDDPTVDVDDLDWRMRPGSGYLALGQVLFMNVVSDLSDQLAIPVEEITQNTTKTSM